MHRRRFLEGSAAALGGVAFATSQAFAGGQYDRGARHFRAQGANLPTPREETLVMHMGETQVWDIFNPFIANGEVVHYGLHQFCREPFFIDDFMTGELVPWLAESYEYNEDFTEFTIKTRPEAKWNDGTPMTSEDWKFTYDLLSKNEEFYQASDLEAIEKYEIVDKHSFKFTFLEPNPRYHLGHFTAGTWTMWNKVVPKHIWENVDAATYKNTPPVYTGPYKLVESRFDQKYYLWERDDNYWNAANYSFKPKYIMIRTGTTMDAMVQEFLRGDVDIPAIDALNQEMVAGSMDNVVQATYADPCPRGLRPNHASPVFATPEGRWALSLLTDRETIGNTIWQPSTVAAQYPWPNWPANDRWSIPDLQEQYDLTEFNPDKAAELLDSIGCVMDGDWRKMNGEDVTLSFVSPSAVGGPEYEIARLVSIEAQRIGLNMEVVNLQSATYGDALDQGKFDVESGWCCTATTDPYNAYSVKYWLEEDEEVTPIGEKEPTTTLRANIPEFEEVVEELRLVSPDDVENPAYRKGLEMWFQQLPEIPTIQTLYPFVFNASHWTNWPNIDGSGTNTVPKPDLQQWILTLANLKSAHEE